MRLLADENIESRVVRVLETAGHDVVSMSKVAPGMDDREIVSAAWREQRVILTRDKDFGDLVVRDGLQTAGVILVRLRMHALEKAEYLSRALPQLEQHVRGQFVVITNRSIRIRQLPKAGTTPDA